MDNSFFNSQIQMVVYNLMAKLLEEYASNAGSSSSSNASTSVKSAATSATGKFSDLIEKASEKYNVDVKLISAVIKAESNFNPKAESSAGAQGLMQLMPGTAAGLGVTDAFDPAQNVNAGTKLLHRLLTKYSNDISLALAAYNAGSGAVDKYGGIPPYTETQTYVKRVLNLMKSTKEWSG